MCIRDRVCIGSENSVPQWMGWMPNGFLLVLYENRAVLYLSLIHI